MKYSLPADFRCEPFYNGSQSIVICSDDKPFERRLLTSYFYYDITEEERPWENPASFLPQMFVLWREREAELRSFFQKRDGKNGRTLMIAMTAVFIDALFWLNKKKVGQLQDIEAAAARLKHKPVNIDERLRFILIKPDSYHSFTQLRALMNELEKLTARSKAMGEW